MSKLTTLTINKTKIALYPVKEVRSIYLDIRIKAGSWYEPGPQWGAFHLLEHLLFEGTQKFKTHQEMEYFKESHGISNNAWTGGKAIGFWFKFPDISINEGLDLFEEIVFKPIIPIDKIPKEINIISQEFKERWDNPNTRFNYFVMDNLIGKNSTFYRDGIGQPEYLATIDYNYLTKLHQDFFQPQNICISIVGNFDTEKIIEKLNFILNKYPNQKISRTKWGTIQPNFTNNQYTDNVNQSYLTIDWPLSNNQEFDIKTRYGINIFNYIFGIGQNSVLFKKIRQELGLVYFIKSRYWSVPKNYFFEIIADIDNKNAPQLIDGIKNVVHEFINQPINQKEFEHVRNYMDMQTLMIYDSISNIGNNIIEDLFYEKKIYLPEDSIKIAQSVKSEEIQELFKEKLNWNNAQIFIMNPKLIS